MQTIQLTGTYHLPNGTPAKGTVEIIPSVKLIVDDQGNVIMSGRAKVALDAEGSFTVDLPATDDITLNPTDFGYTLVAKLNHTHLPAVSFQLPAAVAVVDVTDVVEADPSVFVPVVSGYVTDAELEAALAAFEGGEGSVGPAGPQGPQGATGPAGPQGPAGEGSGSSSLLVVSGGTVDLPNAEADGFLIGYKVTATTVIEGTSFAPGSYVFERNTTAGGGWTYRTLASGDSILPPDVTLPTAGTLTVNTTATVADLLVTGAMDETALHATPYRFSKDNGTTWTAWQAGGSYQFTGLASGTSFTFKHEVRDAALNVRTGAAVTMSTTTLLAWTTLVHEVTTRPNTTVVNTGATPETTTGGATFIASSAWTSNGTQLVGGGTGGTLEVAYSDTASTKTYEVSCDYDNSAQAANPARGTCSASLHITNTGQALGIKVDSSGAVAVIEGTIQTYTTTIVNTVTAGLTGNIKAEIDTSNGTVRGYHNGTHVFTAVCDIAITYDTFKFAWGAGWTGRLGNIKARVYQ